MDLTIRKRAAELVLVITSHFVPEKDSIQVQGKHSNETTNEDSQL